jgi:lysophospholipase L1-like esterase
VNRRLAVLLGCAAGCSDGGELMTGPPDAGPVALADARPDAPRPDAMPVFDAPPPDAADPPPRYGEDRVHSPVNGAVAANLGVIAMRNAALKDAVFAKVGDSITVAPQFLTCFAGENVDLGGRDDLQATLEHFKNADAAGTSSYQRESLAAGVGWSADAVLLESPTRLEQEVNGITPRYAFVMFGSNDVAARSIFDFGRNLLDVVDRLVAQGVLPLMSTIPPNDENVTNQARVPRYNAVVRGIAQARLLPLMDLNKQMLLLPDHGLSADDLHPNAFPGGACKLTPDGLMYGYNTRNLLSLEALDRARSIVEGDPPLDPAGVPAVTGRGSYDDPFVIAAMPFSDLRDTSRSENDRIDRYDGCMAAQNESGSEYVYRLVLESPVTVRAMVIEAQGVDVDVHLMRGLTAADCVQRNNRELVAMLAAGTHHFVLDTFVPTSGEPAAGEYLFVLMVEPVN